MRKTQKTEKTDHYPESINFSTRPLSARVSDVGKTEFCFIWDQKIEEEMSFKSKVIFFMVKVERFREKYKKQKKQLKEKFIFPIFLSQKH